MDFFAILFLTCLSWFVFYMLNHATILNNARSALSLITPRFFVNLIKCPICVSFWAMLGLQVMHLALFVIGAITLFIGYIPAIVICPPLTLFMELAYQRLKK